MAPKDEQGSSAPLLVEDDVADTLEQGLSESHDFQSIIAARPKRVVQWLQDDAVEKLGEFQISVSWDSFLTLQAVLGQRKACVEAKLHIMSPCST